MNSLRGILTEFLKREKAGDFEATFLIPRESADLPSLKGIKIVIPEGHSPDEPFTLFESVCHCRPNQPTEHYLRAYYGDGSVESINKDLP